MYIYIYIYIYISDRTQTVVINSQGSKSSLVTNGIPQGSVLGTILFLLHTADIGLIAEKHGMNFRSYADDSKLYVHCKAHDTVLVHVLYHASVISTTGWHQTGLNLTCIKHSSSCVDQGNSLPR